MRAGDNDLALQMEAMRMRPTLQDITTWLADVSAFAVVLGASDEKRVEITVSDAYPMTLEAEDGTLGVTCDRGLPPEVEGAVDIAALEEAAKGQARSAAMPTMSEVREVDGKQWVSFRIPLHLEGLTRNELAAAIWEAWKAQELLALQINGLKELEALSTELESLETEGETPSEAAGSSEAPAPPPQPAPAAAPAGRFCSNCGKQAKPGQRFCVGCGTSLEGQA